jgi:hypothetical protein
MKKLRKFCSIKETTGKIEEVDVLITIHLKVKRQMINHVQRNTTNLRLILSHLTETKRMPIYTSILAIKILTVKNFQKSLEVAQNHSFSIEKIINQLSKLQLRSHMQC